MSLHRLLERQLRKHLANQTVDVPGWERFIQAVSDTYMRNDEHLALTERSLELSSGEMIDINARLEREIQVVQERTREAEQSRAEARAAEVRLTQLLRELESANQELKDFAYIVSHDLKAPLRAIGSLANWLLADYGDKIDEDGKEQFNLLVGRVKRMQGLIDGILQYSRVGRVRETVVDVDLAQSVPQIVDLLSPPSCIQVETITAMPHVSGEKTRIEQVFQNLISNAIKYMDKPQGTIRIGHQEEPSEWRFFVQDNGPGIDARYHTKIFQIFQTLSPRDEVESTGIGLTVVKKVVEMHGGRVWLESTMGQGTTFYFTLPKVAQPMLNLVGVES